LSPKRKSNLPGIHSAPLLYLRRITTYGGLPTNLGRIRGAILVRGGMSRPLESTPLARRFRLSTMRGKKAWPHGALLLRCAHCVYQASVTAGTVFQDTTTTDHVVPRHVVRNQPKERGRCSWLAASAGTEQLPDVLGLAAQITAGHGPARSRPPERLGGGGRNLSRRSGRRCRRATAGRKGVDRDRSPGCWQTHWPHSAAGDPGRLTITR